MCEGSHLLGLKDSTLFCLFFTYQQTLLLIGSTWGLMFEMALYVDLTNKENHSDPWDWPNCLNNIVFFHWPLPFQSYETSGFQTSGYVTAALSYKLKINHPFREFFIGGQVWLFAAPWTACQTPLSMGFQEYWSGLPGKNTGVGPWTVTRQAPWSMGFSR